MKIALSLIDFDGLNSPEVIVGLISMIALLLAIVIGFFYKRHQSRKHH
jgi:hypothetical protein